MIILRHRYCQLYRDVSVLIYYARFKMLNSLFLYTYLANMQHVVSEQVFKNVNNALFCYLPARAEAYHIVSYFILHAPTYIGMCGKLER